MLASSEAHSTDKGPSPWRYRTRYVWSEVTLDTCDTPVELVNVLTDDLRLVPCGRYCDKCRTRYRRRVKETARWGLDLSTHPYAYLVTLTAPGGRTNLADWNPYASGCWNRLRTNLRRFDPTLQYMLNTEIQKRGAIHHHVIMLTSQPLTRNRVSRLAKRAGYGWMCDVAPLKGKADRSRTAAYVSKYVTKARDQRDHTPWEKPDPVTGEILTRATYRTWSRSFGYGIPMREVKRRAFLAWQSAQDVPEWAFHHTSPDTNQPTTEASPP